jgi:nitrogen fixation NifU-like protein
VRALSRAFKGMMSIHEQSLDGEGLGAGGDGAGDGDGIETAADAEAVKLGDLEALRGVVKFPVRIKCATLAWNTLQQGLDEAS